MERLNPQAVIFDLGSTLIEYESEPWPNLIQKCTKAAWEYLDERGYPLPSLVEFTTRLDDVKNEYRKTAAEKLIEWTVPQAAEKLLQSLGLESGPETVDNFFEAYYRPVGEKLFIYEDTIETLRKIKESGRKIGLISNTIFPEETHQSELRRFGIAEYFDFTIFSSTFKLRKPHRKIFEKGAEMAGFTPEECVYIGDRYLEDVVGPGSIGMPSILKRWGKREYPVDMPEAKRIIRNLSELPEQIEL